MKQPCSECKELPKAPGRHRCPECALRHRPMLEQIEAAKDRLHRYKASNTVGDTCVIRTRVPSSLWPMGRRWCSGCQSFRMVDFGPGHASDFAPNASRCRPCASQSAHKARLVRVYDITPEQYNELLQVQAGCCAICLARAATTRLAVDHDHKTGKVRGLLCKRCNHDLLGTAHDSYEILYRAAMYLDCPPASDVL